MTVAEAIDHVVYLAGYQPHPDVLYLKAGKSSKPDLRMSQYGTMIPGGLSFMWKARVTSRGEANAGERELMVALSGLEGVEAVGGEWFKAPPIMRLAAIDILREIGKEVLQVRCRAPEPFGIREPGKRGVARKKKLRRVA